MVGRNVHVRDAQSRFQHSKSTIHHVFHNVLDALLYLYADYVRTPPDHIPARIQKDWGKMKYFADVRGAIDGTHIAAHIPIKYQTPFRNRKGTLSQNVLAGCTLDMYFFYIFPGWEGSANDSRVLDNAIFRDFPQLPGRIYLADETNRMPTSQSSRIDCKISRCSNTLKDFP